MHRKNRLGQIILRIVVMWRIFRNFAAEVDKILKVEQNSLSFTTRQNSSKLGSALAVLRVHSVNDYAR